MSRATVPLESFSADELGHGHALAPELLVKLQAVRYLAGEPIHISSGLRPEDDGEHGSGEAVDITDNRRGEDVGSRWRHHVLKASYAVGFSRIGVYDKHIHLGVSRERDQSVTWWGQSD